MEILGTAHRHTEPLRRAPDLRDPAPQAAAMPTPAELLARDPSLARFEEFARQARANGGWWWATSQHWRHDLKRLLPDKAEYAAFEAHLLRINGGDARLTRRQRREGQ